MHDNVGVSANGGCEMGVVRETQTHVNATVVISISTTTARCVSSFLHAADPNTHHEVTLIAREEAFPGGGVDGVEDLSKGTYPGEQLLMRQFAFLYFIFRNRHMGFSQKGF